MKNNLLEKKLFTQILLNENGGLEKRNREWVEIIGSFLCVVGIFGLMILGLVILGE